MKILNRKLISTAVLTAVMVGTFSAARADDNPYEVRIRAIYLDPANGSQSFAPLGIPEDAIHINAKWLPDVDGEWYFAPHWSSELVLTYPQKQTVTVEKSVLGGPAKIGTFNHLPPVLTLKYGFFPDSAFRPYVGAGINVTYLSDVNLQVPTVGRLNTSHWSVGPAAQAGFDFAMSDHWYLNLDAKWAFLRANVDLGNTHVSQARVNPLLFGFGIGYRFGGGSPTPTVTKAATPAIVAAPEPAPAPAPAPAAAPVAAAPAAPAAPPPAAPKEVVLKGVNFATDSAVLTAQSEKILADAVTAIHGCGCSKIVIRGYTDNTGQAKHNLALSDRRAHAVMEYFIAHGIAAGELSAEGFGQERPIASNATSAGRAENRRVTIETGN